MNQSERTDFLQKSYQKFIGRETDEWNVYCRR